jgi:hypothetical protein
MGYETVILIKFLTIVVEVVIRICLDLLQFQGTFIDLESSNIKMLNILRRLMNISLSDTKILYRNNNLHMYEVFYFESYEIIHVDV